MGDIFNSPFVQNLLNKGELPAVKVAVEPSTFVNLGAALVIAFTIIILLYFIIKKSI